MAININGTGSITGLSSISSPTISGGNFPAGTAGSPGITLSGDADTGLYSPGANQIAIATSGVAALTVDASQRVGLGTSSPSRNLTVYNTAANPFISIEGSNTSSPGLLFGDTDNNAIGQIRYDHAADKMQFSVNGAERAVIDSSGRLGVGTTSPGASLEVNGNIRISNANNLQLANTGDVQFLNAAGTSYSTGIIGSSDNMILYTTDLERARIDSSGRLLVGTSSARDKYFNTTVTPGFQIEGTTDSFRGASIVSSAVGSGAYFVLGHQRSGSIGGNTVLTNGEEVGMISFQGSDGTELVEAARIEAFVDGTPGANDMPGRLVFSTTADGASSPTQRMVIRQNGILGVNVNSPTFNYGDAVGFQVNTSGDGLFMRDGAPCLYLNRKTSDGDLLVFAQDGANEGTISVSGTTVSYNGAHLSRWTQLPGNAERTEILRGSVLSNIDEMCEWGDEDNEQLNRMKVSDVEGDKNVSGVFQAWDDDDDTYTNDFYCAMTGDFIIRIGAGVTVERGDLLMSAGDGTAKPQDDDIIRSKTIAKVTSTNVSCTYDDGSYCVPCVLMAC